jgi:hypothetical protein
MKQSRIMATSALALTVAALAVAAAWPSNDAPDGQGLTALVATSAALAGAVAVIVASAYRRMK